MKPIVVVIVGPTASGKTNLSIELAKKIDGEIVSSDSMQVYKDMNIGTAKVTEEEMCGIKHYLIDYVGPNERYTVSDFKQDAENAIEDILSKSKTPIVVGGTGLYVNSLIYGIEYQDMEFDEAYRNDLMRQAETPEGLEKLYQEAMAIDEEATLKISPNDKKRIVRILEIYKATGMNKTEQEILSRKKGVKYDYRVFGINYDRQKLYERIDMRVDIMIKQGLVEEVKGLLEKYSEFPTAMQGLGYKEVVKYLNGEYTYEEMIETIKKESRHYAKRQMTWFRKNKETIWLDSSLGVEENVNTILKEINWKKKVEND